VILFTNRNSLIFDQSGKQIPELQLGITCYSLDARIAAEVADHAVVFELAKWGVWKERIDKREFLYLLGLGYVNYERDFGETALARQPTPDGVCEHGNTVPDPDCGCGV
jgi:hypothetical protein